MSKNFIIVILSLLLSFVGYGWFSEPVLEAEEFPSQDYLEYQDKYNELLEDYNNLAEEYDELNEESYEEESYEEESYEEESYEEESTDCTIKGNESSSGELIYHMEDQQFYEITDAEEWFCSKEEAENAGYRQSLR